MRTKTTMIMNKKLGRRRPKRMPYEETIGRERFGVLKKQNKNRKNWAEKAKETVRKISTLGRKVPLKKSNHEKELG